jgi:hypothetical protein
VYAQNVKHYLEKRGVKLPLTHKELSSMKHEAQSLAKGGKVKRKSKRKVTRTKNINTNNINQEGEQNQAVKGKKNQAVQQSVTIHIKNDNKGADSGGKGGISAPGRSGSGRGSQKIDIKEKIPRPQRPDTFSALRAFSLAGQMIRPFEDKIAKDAERKKIEEEAIERFKKEESLRRNVLTEAIKRDLENQRNKAPINPVTKPIRSADNNDELLQQTLLESMKAREQYLDEIKEDDSSSPAVSAPISHDEEVAMNVARDLVRLDRGDRRRGRPPKGIHRFPE